MRAVSFMLQYNKRMQWRNNRRDESPTRHKTILGSMYIEVRAETRKENRD